MAGERYVALCNVLEAAGNALGLTRIWRTIQGPRPECRRISVSLELASIPLDAECVLNSSMTGAILAGTIASAFVAILCQWTGSGAFGITPVAGLAASLIAWDAIKEYPGMAARRSALDLVRDAPEATNLMIMSLRHEPSLPKAIQLASGREGKFSRELKRCTWGVIMGRSASFEDSLHEMGERWSGYVEELKGALHSMVTSSCESTEDGRRRALDRASTTMAVGARKRIEEYALSLSFPSMVLFGVGILLPLIAGSFLPMLSWSIWNPEVDGDGATGSGRYSNLNTVLVMNVIFPTIAAFVAIGAVSRHPLRGGHAQLGLAIGAGYWGLMIAGAAFIASVIVSLCFLDGLQLSMALLLAATVPGSVWLIASGRHGAKRPVGNQTEMDVEDVLFRTGARMVDGENFESALSRTVRTGDHSGSPFLHRLARSSWLKGDSDDRRHLQREDHGGGSNAEQAFLVVREAASKDEIAAGMLAMDLAVYMKELRDIERTLMSRLRPTISMMRTTVYALGPVVLGVTFAIYLSLASMVAPEASTVDATVFFLVLGIFLAEIDGIVTYFVWGIERRRDTDELKRSAGICILCSTIVFSCTALLAS